MRKARLDMWTLRIYWLLIWAFLTDAESNFLFEYTDGWIPVSSETVYEQIKRQNIQTPHYIASQDIQVLHTDINNLLLEEEGIKPTDNSRKEIPVTELLRTEVIENIIENCTIQGSNCKPPNVAKNPTQVLQYTTKDNNEQLSRKSKKIAEVYPKNQQDFFLPETPVKNTKERTYEVTEDVAELELDKINLNKEEYTYESVEKKNQTKTLFQILAKYKIGKDDILPNYAISRNHRVQSPLKQNIFVKPSPNQISNRYNNPNHLPVDPILAVLLSNYGFYLQGMYGRSNKYSNLYGYLASNNIHNNRPFGVYKIFSDTDSDH